MVADGQLDASAWRRSSAGILFLVLALGVTGDAIRRVLAPPPSLFNPTAHEAAVAGVGWAWGAVGALVLALGLALVPRHVPAMGAATLAAVVGYVALLATMHGHLQATPMLALMAVGAFHYQRLSDRMRAMAGVELDADEMARTDGRDPGGKVVVAIALGLFMVLVWWLGRAGTGS